MIWFCDIPGASATGSALHFALHVSLAAFVLGAGLVFLTLAVIAYRRPVSAPRRVADPGPSPAM